MPKPIQNIVVLPCDIGKQLFIPCQNRDILTTKVQAFYITEFAIRACTAYDIQYTIGEDAFLTYEEARENLKEKGWE